MTKQTTANLLDEIELDVTDTIGDCPGDTALTDIMGLIQSLRQNLTTMTVRRIKSELQNIEERITDWLLENTEQVFEEAPDMDNARSAIQEFLD